MAERTASWTSPPSELDGADVLYYAILREFIQPKAAAICHNPDSQSVYLFYCNDRWEVVEDTVHDTVEEAIASLSQRHSGARDKLQRPA